jgi:dipeptidyl aminopeptidase/acylaminoacyl peptidase
VWPVDPERVVVTGFSMGGIGAWYLAGRHPDRFCAAVPVAAHPAGEPDGSVPFYVLHSRQDRVLDLEPTERAVAALRKRGGHVELVILDGLGHYQTGRYVEPLRGAVDWLRRLWSTGK